MRAVALLSAVAITASLTVAVPGSVTEDSSWASTPQTCLDMHGEGTEKTLDPPTLNVSEGVYEIGTASQLVYLSENFDKPVDGDSVEQWREQNFVQTAPIDLDGCHFTPIGDSNDEFGGVYNGQWQPIYGLTVNGASRAGLFGLAMSSTLKRIVLVEASITGSGTTAGALVGSAIATDILESSATGSVTASGNRVGGLVGGIQNLSSVVSSFSDTTVTATNGAAHGGLVGSVIIGSEVHDSYALGAVSGDQSVGGLVGEIGGSSVVISRSYAANSTTGTSSVGGLVGSDHNAVNHILTDSFWDATATEPSLTTSAGGTVKTTAELTSFDTYSNTATVGLDTAWPIVNGWEAYDPAGGKVWGILEGTNDGFPFLLWQYLRYSDILDFCGPLSEDGFHLVSSARQLENVGFGGAESPCGLADKYRIASSIDLEDEEWTPIGDSDNPFTGVFDGGGHFIANLALESNLDPINNQGFFGVVGSAAEISNVNLQGVSLNTDGARDGVGSLAGRSIGATITNSSASGLSFSIGETSGSAGSGVGGLVGVLRGGSLINSSVAGTIQASSGEGVGGIVGRTGGTSLSTIENATAEISITGFNESGGIVGRSDGTTTITSSTVTASAVTGGRNETGGLIGRSSGTTTITGSTVLQTLVTSGNDETGGLIGRSSGTTTITGSTVRETIVTGVDDETGGLIGIAGNGTTILGSHFSGDVAGKRRTGGLIGLANTVSIIDSYATGTVTGTSYTGGLIGQLTPGTGGGDPHISRSFSTAVVEGTSSTGGLVGEADSAIIEDSYARGSVTGGTARAGGLIGESSGMTLTRSYSTGSVSSRVTDSTDLGGLIGLSDASDTITASFWDTDTSGQQTSAAGVGKTTAEMVALSTFFDGGWSIASCTTTGQSTLWGIQEGDYPFLTWQDTPQLAACETPTVPNPQPEPETATGSLTNPGSRPGTANGGAEAVADANLSLSQQIPGATTTAPSPTAAVTGGDGEGDGGVVSEETTPDTDTTGGGEQDAGVQSDGDALASGEQQGGAGWLWAIGLAGLGAALLIAGGVALTRLRS